jgi:hypothetical protein
MDEGIRKFLDSERQYLNDAGSSYLAIAGKGPSFGYLPDDNAKDIIILTGDKEITDHRIGKDPTGSYVWLIRLPLNDLTESYMIAKNGGSSYIDKYHLGYYCELLEAGSDSDNLIASSSGIFAKMTNLRNGFMCKAVYQKIEDALQEAIKGNLSEDETACAYYARCFVLGKGSDKGSLIYSDMRAFRKYLSEAESGEGSIAALLK